MNNGKGMLTIEQLENGSVADRIIILKSVYKTKHTVQPGRDKKTNWFAGVPRLSEDDKKKENYYVEPETTKLLLEDGVEFNLNEEVDRKNWAWVKELKEVAMSFEEAQMSPSAMFYVEIEGIESQKSNKRSEIIFKAQSLVFEDSPVNYENRALLLGFDMEGENPETIKEFLLSTAKRTPEVVIHMYTGNTMGIKLLILKAMKKNIITNEAGAYKFGNTILGMTEEGVVHFLQEKGNSSILDLLDAEVNPEYHAKKTKSADKED